MRRFFWRLPPRNAITSFCTSVYHQKCSIVYAFSKNNSILTFPFQVRYFSDDNNNQILSSNKEELPFDENSTNSSSLSGLTKALNTIKTYESHRKKELSGEIVEKIPEATFTEALWGMVVTGCYDDAIQEILNRHKLDTSSNITIEMIQPLMDYFKADESNNNFPQLSHLFSQLTHLQKCLSADELVKVLKCNPLLFPKHFKQFLQTLEIIESEPFPVEDKLFITYFDNCRIQMDYQAGNNLYLLLKKKIGFSLFSIGLYCSAIDIFKSANNLENLNELMYNFFLRCKQQSTEDVNNFLIKKYSTKLGYLNEHMHWILSKWNSYLLSIDNQTVLNHNQILQNVLELLLAYPFKVEPLSKKNILLILTLTSKIQLSPQINTTTKDLLVLLIDRLFPYIYLNFQNDGFVVHSSLLVMNRLKKKEKFYKFLQQVKNNQMDPQFDTSKLLDHLIFTADYEGALNLIQLATNQKIKPSSEYYQKVISFRHTLAEYALSN